MLTPPARPSQAFLAFTKSYDGPTMMARTQITLDPELHRRARARAGALGLSVAEYVRRLVVADVGEHRPAPRVEDVFDLGDSGESDIASQKDAYLAAAAGAERLTSG
jgi:hypothetical protein